MQIVPAAIRFSIFTALAFLISHNAYNQNFEGEITFVKESVKDTNYFSIKVKGNKIRYEELNRNMQAESYQIVDLNDKRIFTINPKRKIYVEISAYPFHYKRDSNNYNIIKSENYKTINGLKCYQWRIQNKKEDTEIGFWIPKEQYPFFATLQQFLNPNDKFSQYFLNIPENSGFLPFESVERSMLREWRMRVGVVSIEKKQLNNSIFEIPSGYKLFQKN